MKCFYHSADLDGKCSAAIVKHFKPGVELIGYNYGNEFPWGTINIDETVYMVDVSLQPFEKMRELNTMCNLIWIDHHKSSIEEAEKAKVIIQGIQKSGIGACAHVWNWFTDKPLPKGVKLLAEYDVWNHSNPQTLFYQYGLRNYINDPTGFIWQSILNENDLNHSHIIGTGEIILEYTKKDYAARVKTLCFETEMDGLKLIVGNHAMGNSQFFDSIWDEEKYDAMCLFYWKKDYWSIHLYSTKKDVDLSVIAKNRGGGGHKGAAGFQCKALPFCLMPPE